MVAVPFTALTALALVSWTAAPALGAAKWRNPEVEHPRVGGRFTWSSGFTFGRTDDGRLHTAYATDHIAGRMATDSGPFVGTYYLRGSVGDSDAVSWSKPKRVTPRDRHAARSALAAEGKNVYVGYTVIRKYWNYDPKDPRVFYFRRNTNSGASHAWRAPIRLSPRKGRVDFPMLAAAGDNVYATWTNGKTGAVVLARSTDEGVHWSSSVVGDTDRKVPDGFGASPGICADGSLVGIAWQDDRDLRLVARVSSDGGSTFGAEQELTPSSDSWAQCAAFDGTDDRVTFAWDDGDRVWVSIFTFATESFSNVSAYDYDAVQYSGGYGPAPTFSPDGSEVGVAFTGCRISASSSECGWYARVDLLWIEGAADASSWEAGQLLATKSAERAKADRNDYPSVVWYDADTRFVIYHVWTATGQRYEMALQRGRGL